MEDGADVPPEPTTEETPPEGDRLPSHEERLEHCYEQIRVLRAEIAELRSHSHPELAHAVHEHEYAHSGHTHEVKGDETTEQRLPGENGASGSGSSQDASPSPTHPYFRKVKLRG